MRPGTVSTDAPNDDVHGVGIGHRITLGIAHGSRRQIAGRVQGHAIIRSRESGIKAVGQHGLCATDPFLRGLANENQRADPPVAQCCQDSRGADERSHVNIMAAGVHGGHLAPVIVLRARLAGVGKTGFFQDRQAIEVGTDQNGGPRAVLEHAHHAVATHLGGHFKARLLQLIGHTGGGLRLLKGNLRRCVKLLVQLQQTRVLGLHASSDSEVRIGRLEGAEGPGANNQQREQGFHGRSMLALYLPLCGGTVNPGPPREIE